MNSNPPANADFVNYNNALPDEQKNICTLLMREIDKNLPNATSRIYYANPVWFISDNPIVGYNVASKGISLLFWSGQSFKTPGLVAAGKFKATKIIYRNAADIDVKVLEKWLEESKKIQWDYKNLRTNCELVLIEQG